MRFDSFSDVMTFGHFQPISAARMLVDEFGEIVDAVV